MKSRRRPVAPIAQPIVTSITPSSATPTGGSTHTVAGRFLETTQAVRVGGTSAAFLLSNGVLTFTAPALASTTYPVEVQTGGGVSRVFPGLVVSSAMPTVTSVAPYAGRSNQAQSVTITGTNFTGATSVTFGGSTATSVTVVSSTSITCTTPTGLTGMVTVAVTTPDGTGSLANAYFFLDATGLELWYYGDAGITTVSGNVSQANNLSGSADANRNLAQATAGLRPIFTTAHSNFNGRGAWGTSTTADESRCLASGTFAASIAQAATWYQVFRLPSGRSANNVYLRLNPSGSQSNCHSMSGPGSPNLTVTSNINSFTFAVASDTTYVVCVVYNGASSAVYLNQYNTTSATGNADTAACASLFTGTWQGGTEPSRYLQSAIIARAGVDSAAKRQEIMQALGTIYGVTVTA